MLKTMIRNGALATALAIGSLGAASGAMAQNMPMVGGAPMDPAMTIPENASKASNLTTLVAAVKAAGLAETLSGPGPFTVFAPDRPPLSGPVGKLVQGWSLHQR